jgi:tetratricopeptide (TPR) repeat protein
VIARVAAVCCLIVSAWAESTPTPTPGTNYVPEIARAAAAEGNEAFARGQLDRARRAYEKVLAVDPANLLGLVNLGVVEFTAGNHDAAETHLKKAVRARLETAPAWLTLGIIYMDADRLDEALAALTQAALHDPTNPRVHNYLGVVVGRMGWIDGAQSELRKAVAIDPNYSEAHYNLAVFYLQRSPPSVELAKRHYFRSIELGAEPDPELEKKFKAGPDPG